jgi:hypothetical protein
MHGNTELRAAAEGVAAKITELAEAPPAGGCSEQRRRHVRVLDQGEMKVLKADLS